MLSPATVLSSNANTFSTVIVSILFLGLAVLAMKFLANKRAAKSQSSVSRHPKPVLTEAEARFFRSLESAVDGEYLIWPQLPLWTFIETRSNDSKAAMASKNKINLKRVDFCLVDRQTLTVQMAIELDDRSHQRPDRQRRDAFIETVLKEAGVPLIRIPAASVYNSEAISRQLGMVETKDGNKSAAVSLAR